MAPLLAALVLVAGSAACGHGHGDGAGAGAGAPTSAPASLAALPEGRAGVEVAVDAVGALPGAELTVAPSPGWRADAVVSSASLATGSDLLLEGHVEVRVVRVEPDGGHRLRLELQDVRVRSERARPGVVTDLWLRYATAAGTTLEVDRDAAGARTARNLTFPVGIDPEAEAVAAQLVEAPVLFAGPVPGRELGTGAGWTWSTVDADGSTGSYRFRLVRLDRSAYEIDAVYEAAAADGTLRAEGTVVLQGAVGAVLPHSQTWDVTTTGGPDGTVQLELTVELSPT